MRRASPPRATPSLARFSCKRLPLRRVVGDGWGADFPSAAGFIRPLFSCAAFVPASPEQTTNISGFCDHSLDAAMVRAVALESQDPPAATLLWQRIERDILAQAPVVPTVNPRNVDFVSERVGNYQYHPQWGVLLDQLWVK